MSEPAETGPVALSRLLDEIRADRGWRDAIDALSRSGDSSAAAAEPPTPPERLTVPPGDHALASSLDALVAAIGAADAVVPIQSGRPVVGDAMAVLRRQIHAEIRIYQDRQTRANQHVLAALRRLVDALDPARPDAPLAALWTALGRLEARIEALETRAADAARTAERADELRRSVGELRGTADALERELEPLGNVRVAVEALAARLDALERDRPSG